jgi:protein-disulfide isomerase
MCSLKVPVTPEDHIQGNINAPITLIEYGDYQCPFCGQAYAVIKEVQKHFGDQLRFVFRNFPLSEMHPMAEPAAEAAEFANDHNKFWKMHDLIYENQEDLSLSYLIELGRSLKLPVDDLELSLRKKMYEPIIKRDFIGGVRSGVNGTPTFYINDQRYDGAFDYEHMVSAIESSLSKA